MEKNWGDTPSATLKKILKDKTFANMAIDTLKMGFKRLLTSLLKFLKLAISTF